MEEKKANTHHRSPVLKMALLLTIMAAAFAGMYIFVSSHSQTNLPIITPSNGQENTTVPEKIIVCDHDRVCDAGENIADCPGDCIASTGLSAARSSESNMTDTTPTVTVKMQDPDGIKSCGVSPTDSTQWDCTVKTPGNITTDVDCTLKNYKLDGTYMMMLRCKNNNGNDVTPVMMDHIVICADPLGCKR